MAAMHSNGGPSCKISIQISVVQTKWKILFKSVRSHVLKSECTYKARVSVAFERRHCSAVPSLSQQQAKHTQPIYKVSPPLKLNYKNISLCSFSLGPYIAAQISQQCHFVWHYCKYPALLYEMAGHEKWLPSPCHIQSKQFETFRHTSLLLPWQVAMKNFLKSCWPTNSWVVMT